MNLKITCNYFAGDLTTSTGPIYQLTKIDTSRKETMDLSHLTIQTLINHKSNLQHFYPLFIYCWPGLYEFLRSLCSGFKQREFDRQDRIPFWYVWFPSVIVRLTKNIKYQFGLIYGNYCMLHILQNVFVIATGL